MVIRGPFGCLKFRWLPFPPVLMKPAFLKSEMSCRIFLGIEYHKNCQMSNFLYKRTRAIHANTTNAGNGVRLSAPLRCRKRLQSQSQACH